MKKLYIFGLILAFACCGENINQIRSCQHMTTISDANPIQFWPVACATWNESDPPGVHHYCFCQPFQCTDPIKVDIESNDVASFEQIVSDFDTDFDSWFNTANGVTPNTGGSTANWIWSSDYGGSLKVTTVATFGTKGLRLSGISLPQQIFTIRIKFVISSPASSTSLHLRLLIRDSSNTQLFNQDFSTVSGGSEVNQDFVITDETIWLNADHFWLVVVSPSFQDGDIIHFNEISYIYDVDKSYSLIVSDEDGNELYTTDFVNSDTSYSASFIPSDHSICDKKISLTIHDNDNDIDLYKSDCLNIKNEHRESLLIEYTNHENYAGILYGSQTPDPSFSIRIPAIFFETRFPQEGEDFQTSSNEVISLNSQVKEQRLLSTDRMPIYMHRKMALILNHQFVFIHGEYWVKGGENYEKKEKSDKRDSFDMYTCWLTRQDYVVRNIL